MRLEIELGGGLELIAKGKKMHPCEIQENDDGGLKIRDLLPWVRDNIIVERHELFMRDDTVRPGILVLVNECDWELSGCLDTDLEDGDNVIFISTLHGG